MGNHVPNGIPPLLAKNWQPVVDHPNSFRNKVTCQYTHKHIINIEDMSQIESFKHRMKQTNIYICRVLFYHQYHDSIYHVYTDEIHLQPNVGKPQQWRFLKIKIIESFAQLAHTYGFFKVCRQMIGADSNGHPKIWIHPDPVCPKPWAYCSSQALMLADILNILQNIQQKSNLPKSKKPQNRSAISNTTVQYTSFSQYIRLQSQSLNNESAYLKNKPNRNSSFLQNTSANMAVSQNGNIQGQRKKKNLNKTYASTKQTGIYAQQKTSDIGYNFNREPRFSNTTDYKDQINSLYRPSNVLQKLFNPTVCQTSRDEQQQNKVASNYNYGAVPRKNISLERPTTHANYSSNNVYMVNHQKRMVQDKNKSFHQKGVLLKRRDTENFKLLLQSTQNQTRQDKSKSMTSGILKPMQKSIVSRDNQKSIKKSPLGKLITQTSQTFKPNNVAPKSPTYSPVHHQKQSRVQNKSFHGFYQPKNLESSLSNTRSYLNKTNNMSKRQIKNTSIPNFLMKSNTQIMKQMWESAPAVEKYPSTERQVKQMPEHQSKTLNMKQTQSVGNLDKNQQIVEQQQNFVRGRKNTVAILKQQLNNILESPIQPSQKPVSEDYENFKSVKMFYREPHFLEDPDYSMSQKDQLDVIKQKVQQKKARFAQLKLDAKKILQDSI